jgi:hypothetical protein
MMTLPEHAFKYEGRLTKMVTLGLVVPSFLDCTLHMYVLYVG